MFLRPLEAASAGLAAAFFVLAQARLPEPSSPYVAGGIAASVTGGVLYGIDWWRRRSREQGRDRAQEKFFDGLVARYAEDNARREAEHVASEARREQAYKDQAADLGDRYALSTAGWKTALDDCRADCRRSIAILRLDLVERDRVIDELRAKVATLLDRGAADE